MEGNKSPCSNIGVRAPRGGLENTINSQAEGLAVPSDEEADKAIQSEYTYSLLWECSPALCHNIKPITTVPVLSQGSDLQLNRGIPHNQQKEKEGPKFGL